METPQEKKLDYLSKPLQNYIDRVATKTPVPGGGSVSACVATLSAALLNMVLDYTLGKEKYAVYQAELEALREENKKVLAKLSRYIEEDSRVYSLIRKYSSEEKNPVLEEKYLKQSAEIHLDICETALQIVQFAGLLAEKGNRGLISDTGIAASLALSSFDSAKMNVMTNLKYIGDREFVKKSIEQMSKIEGEVHSKGEAVYKKAVEVLNTGGR